LSASADEANRRIVIRAAPLVAGPSFTSSLSISAIATMPTINDPLIPLRNSTTNLYVPV
jgi:hypothetical protein